MRLISHLKDVVKGKAKLLSPRSSKWPTVRKHFLETNPYCAACGHTSDLEVHHVVPFHEDPSKELDPSNLITLCDRPGPKNHHLLIGHSGSFRKSNPNVREDAEAVYKSLKR